MVEMPDPKLTVEYITAVITTVASLFLTQGLITNGVGKLVTGLASVLVPLVFVIAQGIVKSKVHAAKLIAVAHDHKITPTRTAKVTPTT